MKASIDEFVSVIDRLTARLDELENRVAALEHHPAAIAAGTQAAIEQHPLAQVSRSSNVMPVIGKIFLGMAGAYLLRAVAESGILPKTVIAGVAVVYAASWILWAARTSPAAIFASTAYASTAALILPPMLWELTLRFKVMSASIAAGVLVAFVACSAMLAWKRKLASVIWTPSLAAAVAAVALMLGTRDPPPFIAALLLIALITETAAIGNRWLSVRPLVATAVNLGVLALIAIYTSANGASPEYKPLTTGILLWLFAMPLAIYGASIFFRTVLLRLPIGNFEILQMILVFLLGTIGILRVTHQAAATVLGFFDLLAAAACYFFAFLRFGNLELRRNYHVFCTWAVTLVVAGSRLIFPARTATFCLGVAALAATLTGLYFRRFSLAVHGMVYLIASALVAGLLQSCGAVFTGETPPVGWLVWAASVFALLCGALVWRGFDLTTPPWQQRTLKLTAIALCTASALVAATSLGLLTLSAVTAGQIAAMRTLVICILAVFLGWSGPRLRRIELTWLAYALIILCTLKLLLQDLRTGSTGAIAFSLFCYGMIWVLVPRYARSSKGVTLRGSDLL